MSGHTEVLTSWNAGLAKQAVVDFVERTVADDVPVEERIAVFDNDGTLWCEKPMPIQADFILRRLAEMAEADPELRARQPWRRPSSVTVAGWARSSPSTTPATRRACRR